MLRAACTALRIEATAEDKLNLICYVSYDSYGHFSPLLFVHLPLPVRFLFVCLSLSGSLAIGSLSPPFHTAQRRHFPSSIDSSSPSPSSSLHFPINSIRFFLLGKRRDC